MRLREFATRLNELALGAGLPAEPVASGQPDEAMWTVRTQANEYLVKFDFEPEPQEDEYDDYDDYERAYYNAGMNTAFYARDKNGQWTMDITNVGEKELTQIIATVARLLAEFLKQHKHLTHIGISGKDRRRHQIYQRLIQQNLQRYFPGQEFAIDQGGIRRVIKEFALSPERDDNDDIPDQLVVLANRWWNATDRQPQIEHVLNSLGWSIQQVESEDDAVQLQHRDGTTYFISADDFDPDLHEDWKTALGGAALAGAMALGGAGAADAKVAPAPGPSIQAQAKMSPVDKLKLAAHANEIKGVELAQFLAQCAHESGNFKNMEEVGTPAYFARKYDPRYAPKTAKILGNTEVGDGERYKGRGFIQLTGRDNYRRAGDALGLPLEANPDLAARPDVAAKVAVWYWKNRVASKVKNFHNTKQVTRAINPAGKGLKARQDQFKTYQVAMR